MEMHSKETQGKKNRWMQRGIAMAACVAMIGAFAGCSGNDAAGASNSPTANNATSPPSQATSPAAQDPAATTPDTAGALSGTLTIIGSSSVEPVAAAIADRFTLANPNVTINVQGPGSSAGIKAAQDGSADIGSSSRALKEGETGLTATLMGMDGVAVVVHTSNAVADLTTDQLAKIYKGEITNWKDVGGADVEIQLVVREAGSGTRDAFEELTGLVKDGVSQVNEAKAIFADSTNSVSTNVAQMENAIGYVSFGSLQATTKAVSIDSVACNAETIGNGSYKIARPFLLLTKGEPTELAKAYLDYLKTAEAQEELAKHGLVQPAK